MMAPLTRVFVRTSSLLEALYTCTNQSHKKSHNYTYETLLDAYNSQNSCLACCTLAAPCKVTTFETQSTVLEVSSTDTNGVHTLRAELGASGLTTELELSLLAVVGALSTRGRTFVPGGAGDTCMSFKHDHNDEDRKFGDSFVSGSKIGGDTVH